MLFIFAAVGEATATRREAAAASVSAKLAGKFLPRMRRLSGTSAHCGWLVGLACFEIVYRGLFV